MNRQTDILDELKMLNSPLADLPCDTPFLVPDGYFSALQDTLCSGVTAAAKREQELTGFSKTMPFAIPGGYFTNLAERLADSMVQVEMKIPARVPYETPARYFEELPATLVANIKKAEQPSSKEAKIISFRPQWGRLTRMAAAAVLILGFGFGSYRYLQPHTPEKTAVKQLARLDSESINSYVAQHVEDFDGGTLENAVAATQGNLPASISALNEAEIQEYLQEDGDPLPGVTSETL